MIHLIFTCRREFIGYTNNKRKLKMFLKERGNDNYGSMDIEDDAINGLKSKTPNFNTYELDYYQEYKRMLFGHEIIEMAYITTKRIIDIHRNYVDLKRSLRFIELKDDEKEKVDEYILFIERMLDDLMHRESCVSVSEYFNMDEIVQLATEKFLPSTIL